MGRLIYGSAGTEFEFDDRLLAHLKVAIVAKLRRDEKFLLSWVTSSDNGGGHESLWMHPAIPLQFTFLGSKQPTLNRVWIEELMNAANSTGGLHVLPEPEEAQ